MKEQATTGKITEVRIEDQMKEAYIDYAMSVIVGRALPDVRDGLKPVHRRILYGMFDMGLTPEKPYRKCAKMVGDVMGRFHPHGDQAIYDTLVRMAQDFNMRYPLVDGQGNFGSVDGDNPAAMRYTEARLAKIAMEILEEIRMETVDFTDTYDSTEQEPVVLPCRIPNLLMNGSAGIAVGMATNIPPHNMVEVINGLEALIEDEEMSTEQLMKFVKGPDFPTGGEIIGKQGIKDAYMTGRGKVIVRGKMDAEEMKGGRYRLVITEIPYQVNKSSLIEEIANLVREKRVDGISDIRDESDREGMRVVIELRRDANPYIIQNQLLKHSQLQVTFGIIMLALHDNRPILFNLKDMMWKFLMHRKDVVRRRAEFELKKAKERAHILEGYRIALKNIDEVIAIIKKSKDVPSAREALIARFKFSEIQAQAILDLRLQKLTALEQQAILDELQKLLKRINELEDLLSSERKLMLMVKKELGEVKEKYGDKRRTRISAGEADFDIEDLIQKEDVVITITRDGWVKRLPVDTYRMQGRGGRGIIGLTKKEEDSVKHMFVTSSHDELLFFSNMGQVYRLKAYQIPEAQRTAKGKPIVNILQLKPAEKITAVIPIHEFDEKHYLLMITKDGVVKKTRLDAYETNRKGGIRGISLKQGDELRYVLLTDGERDIVLGTHKGLSIRFAEKDVRDMGRGAAGVRGIMLNRGDEVIGAGVVDDNSALLCVCENGYGKRTMLSYYKRQRRGGKGILTIKVNERNGLVIGIAVVDVSEELLIISERGIMIRQPIKSITATIGRSTQGVRLMRMDDGDRIVAFEVFACSEEENGNGMNGNGKNGEEKK